MMGWPTHPLEAVESTTYNFIIISGQDVAFIWFSNQPPGVAETAEVVGSSEYFEEKNYHQTFQAGNLKCWVGPEYTSSPLLSWTECMLQHRFSSAELNIQGRFNSWVCLELNVCHSWVDPRLVRKTSLYISTWLSNYDIRFSCRELRHKQWVVYCAHLAF